MWSSWIVLPAALALLALLRSLAALARHYRLAKKTGLPVVVSPVQQFNPAWQILHPLVGPLLARAPLGLGFWVRCNRWGWHWHEQDALHRELGDVFLNVDTRGIQLVCADLDVIKQIYARRKAFEYSDIHTNRTPALLVNGISGATDALDWQRHRRILVPPFNENTMPNVWEESLRQALSMSTAWEKYEKDGLSSAVCLADFKTVALNTLAKAGFGYTWDFVPRHERRQAGAGTSDTSFASLYRERVVTFMSGPHSLALIAATPRWLYDRGPDFACLLPPLVRNHVVSMRGLRQQLRQLVAERKADLAAGEVKTRNFLNELVANSEEVLREQSRQSDKAQGLGSGHLAGFNEEESFSNLLNFGIAGYETTAGSMNYCFHILSVYPEYQDWVQEEVDRVLHDVHPDLSIPDYETVFPKLKRCMALIYETVRLYPPIVRHGKEVLGDGQHLNVKGRTVFLPAGAEIEISCVSVHVMEENWGPDSREFRPSRWIQTRPRPPPQGETTGAGAEAKGEEEEEEVFGSPADRVEAFLAWSLPSRDCIGKRFAIVEFVAVMSYLLRRYRIEAVRLEGEEFADTRKRVMAMTRNSRVDLALSMNLPPVEKPVVRLVKRV